MAVEYDNDDIVEDYEVVGEDGDDNDNVRRVSSAGGGPVKRPSESVKPDRPPTSMVGALDDGMPKQKGQISQKSAKMIWFVSIGVSVLCVAAVVGHIVFRGGGDNAANRQNNNQNRGPSRPTVEQTAEQKAGQEFRNAVYKSMKADVSKSSAWRNFVKLQGGEGGWVGLRDKAAQKLDNYQNGKATKEEAQEAVVEALNKCYEALYAFELCRYVYDKNIKALGYWSVLDMDDNVEIMEIDEDLRKNKEVIAYQAYQLQAAGRESKLYDWQKGTSDGIEQVKSQEEWEAKWADAKSKYEEASKNNVFSEEDLKKYTRKP
ncbi:MAG: hypothetical protein L3J82_04100 [Planctomycetes bacterium]|nr:hypothetical protein [Planctomycetota bacterium]